MRGWEGTSRRPIGRWPGRAAALCLLVLPSPAAAYVTDPTVYPPINYAIFRPPAAGASYIDPTFGTLVTRLTDAPDTPNAADSGSLPLIDNEYSTMTPWSEGNAHLLLVHHSYFALYDGQGRYVKDLPLDVNSSSQPRWSRGSPDVFYYLRGNALLSYDVGTDTRAIVRVFGEYTAISGLGESDISEDGDHFVLVGDGRDVFVYTISTDTKGPVLDTTGLGGFDDVYITPDNNVLVGWYAVGSDRYQGVEMYDRNMGFLRQVSRTLGHMDVTRDIDGTEVLLQDNASDPQPVCYSAVVKIRLSDARQTCLFTFDWSLAVHISAPDRSGFAIVSTYAPGDPDPLHGWRAYTNEILRVSLDGSEVRRLAHHRSRPFNTYGWMPRASVSRDGSRVVFSSNYGLQAILGYPYYYSDAYLIDLSRTAPSPPGSQRWPARRYEETDPAVVYGGAWYTNGSPAHSGGTAMFAGAAGDRATFVFIGTAVRWVGYRDEWSGIADVYVDGVLNAEIDTYASPGEAQAEIHTIRGLTPAAHTLVIEATGRSRPESGGTWIWLDAFDAVLRAEEDSQLVTYSGDWFTDSFRLHSQGAAALAMGAGARATFTFTGTTASWIGYRDEWSGIARIYVDGELRAELDTYASPSEAQSQIYTVSGLAAGPHALTIEATYSKSSISEGGWVWVDGFETPP
ncbi:MAG: hypothetical protein AUH92_00880 [Acidobacteria bacterium 13_1_40CM_4_69_4]|nr:MAG: hypothetical protein AUH92_00880 [Acidobacteria bacterium 13_1_40CM_4_69_4]